MTTLILSALELILGGGAVLLTRVVIDKLDHRPRPQCGDCGRVFGGTVFAVYEAGRSVCLDCIEARP